MGKCLDNRGVVLKSTREKKESPKQRGRVMLALVALAYLVLFLFDANKATIALSHAAETLMMVAPILLIVFFLMALLNVTLSAKAIAKHLGEESGLKGWLIALGGGILSHGPAYVWYPLLAQIRQNGAKEGLIVAFLYARSIKVPWLPLMASYFGVLFTVVLTLFVLLGAWLQGVIADILLKHYTRE